MLTVQGVGGHELGPEQPNAVDGALCGGFGLGSDRQVHVDPCGERFLPGEGDGLRGLGVDGHERG